MTFDTALAEAEASGYIGADETAAFLKAKKQQRRIDARNRRIRTTLRHYNVGKHIPSRKARPHGRKNRKEQN